MHHCYAQVWKFWSCSEVVCSMLMPIVQALHPFAKVNAQCAYPCPCCKLISLVGANHSAIALLVTANQIHSTWPLQIDLLVFRCQSFKCIHAKWLNKRIAAVRNNFKSQSKWQHAPQSNEISTNISQRKKLIFMQRLCSKVWLKWTQMQNKVVNEVVNEVEICVEVCWLINELKMEISNSMGLMANGFMQQTCKLLKASNSLFQAYLSIRDGIYTHEMS